MKEEQKIKNTISKIISESKLPKEIREKLKSIYNDYEDASKQCCSSLVRIEENERLITNIIGYINRDIEETKEFIDGVARR